MTRLLLRLFAFLALSAALFGCAEAPKPKRLFWPALPATPYLEWIGTYHSQNDFPKTAAEKRLEAFAGKPAPILFRKPVGIAADGKGRVFVSDAQLGNIRIFDFNTLKVHFLSEQPIGNQPAGLAMDSAGRLYMADAGASQVMVFSPDLVPLFSFGNSEVITKPSYLAINERLGRIYVSDGSAHRIVVFDMQGKHLFSFGQRGQAPGDFFAPQGVAVDRENNVYVCDTLNARVQIFDADGKFLREFGERGDRGWQFESPKAIAIDSEGHLFITDVRKAAVTVYDAQGQLLLYLAGGGSEHPLAIDFPNAIFIDQNDRIYFTDMLKLRFQVWQFLTPAYLEKHPIVPEEAIPARQGEVAK